MSGKRVLFVDDEPGIRLTLPRILEMHGFSVTARASVAEALASMQDEQFDILIADLNIGQPGDGFTVVSAMRRTQPHAVTIILTGYPAFETALEAIRSQVDDYIVKPANVQHLLKLIQEKLENHQPTSQVAVKKVTTLLQENRQTILDVWLAACKQTPELQTVQLSDTERVDHLPNVLDALQKMLSVSPGAIAQETIDAAEEHGRKRREQGFSVPMVLLEVRILRRTIYRTLQQNLLALDISYIITDMIQISDMLDQNVRWSVEAYLRAAVEPGRSGPEVSAPKSQ